MCYEGAEGLKHDLLRTELDRMEGRVKRKQRRPEVELGQTVDTDRGLLWIFKFYPYRNLPLDSNLHAELDILYSKTATGISYEPHIEMSAQWGLGLAEGGPSKTGHVII